MNADEQAALLRGFDLAPKREGKYEVGDRVRAVAGNRYDADLALPDPWVVDQHLNQQEKDFLRLEGHVGVVAQCDCGLHAHTPREKRVGVRWVGTADGRSGNTFFIMDDHVWHMNLDEIEHID